MPIIKKDTAKVLLQIALTDTSKDTLIETLIPIVQRDVVSYCKNDFRDKNVPLYSPSGELIYPNGSRYNFQSATTPTGFVLSSGISFTANQVLDANSGFVNAGFYKGMDVVIEGSLNNDSIYQVDLTATIAAGTLKLIVPDEKPLIVEAAGRYILVAKVKFPDELQLTVKDMIKFHLNKSTGSNINSESIGDYSVSYMSTDYPETILRSLNRYRKFRSQG